jgi:hypothetical protein
MFQVGVERRIQVDEVDRLIRDVPAEDVEVVAVVKDVCVHVASRPILGIGHGRVHHVNDLDIHSHGGVYCETCPPPYIKEDPLMDLVTAFDLVGQTVSLIIDGRRVDGVMVTGHNVSSSGPAYLDLLLPTPVGERVRRRRVRLDQVELAP